MLSLSAKIRKEVGRKVKSLRKKGVLPAVLYGPKIQNQPLEADFKEFEKVYQEAGESTLIKLKINPPGSKQKNEKLENEECLVLIHNVARDPLTGRPIHVDFYQPSLEEKIEADIPIVLEGEALAVKDLGGTLIKNISEIKVKALPQNLPREIKIDISGLKTLEDHILIKDLKVPDGVEVLREPEETVVSVAVPEKVEVELEKPIEEKVEEVKVVEKERKPIAEGEEAPKKEVQKP